jgi:hypothetical protein
MSCLQQAVLHESRTKHETAFCRQSKNIKMLKQVECMAITRQQMMYRSQLDYCKAERI